MKSNKPLKILYISNEDVPASHAGALHTLEVSRGLAARGHSITLVSAAARGRAPTENIDGVRVLRSRMRAFGVKCDLRAAWLLPCLLKERWDAVMERFLTLNGLGVLIATAQDIPYLMEVNSPHLEEVFHRWGNEKKLSGRILHFWVNRQYRRCDLAFAPNPDTVPDICPRREKIIWGVDADAFGRRLRDDAKTSEIRKNLDIRDKFPVLFIGSFNPWQGVIDLPEIIAMTTERLQQIRFIIVGDGPCREKVENDIEKRGLSEYCSFLGNVMHDDLPYIIAASDVGIAPFNDAYYPPLRQFGFFWAPTKVLEYAAGGLPIVSANYPILDELILDGETGVLVEPGNPAAFAAAITNLANDAERCKQMGRRGEEHVKSKYRWETHNEILEQFIEEAISDKR